MIEDVVDSCTSLASAVCERASIFQEHERGTHLYNLAKEKLERVLGIEILKNHPEVLIVLGEILQSQGEYDFQLLGAISHRLFEMGFEWISRALLSEDVNPVQGLCARADLLFSYSNILVDVFLTGKPIDSISRESVPQITSEKLSQAQKDLETALQLEPESPPVFSKIGDLHFLLWRIASDPSLLNSAADYYLKSMNVPFKRNEDPDTLYNLAALESLRGNPEVPFLIDSEPFRSKY